MTFPGVLAHPTRAKPGSLLASALLVAGLALPGPGRASDPVNPCAILVPSGVVVSPTDSCEWTGRCLVDIDFGPRGTSDGKTCMWGAGARGPLMGWTGGRVFDFIDRRRRERDLRDGIEGIDSRFSIGVSEPDSLYRLTIWLADTLRVTGPLSVDVGRVHVADDVLPEAGRRRSMRWLVRPAADRVSFRLAAPACKRFAIMAARLEGPSNARLTVIFPDVDTTRAVFPPAAELPFMTEALLRDQIRRDAEHLITERLSDGRFSLHGAWYENSFPIRALVAAGELLNEPEWSATAFQVLDDFVAQQRPDGNWASDYTDREECPGGLSAPLSANLADIGTMTLALAIAASRTNDIQAARWQAALETYADSVSLPNQDATGGFANRTWQNHDYSYPYTVATATQVSTLAALGRLTSNPRYADAVARGTRWLAAQVLPDGRLAFRPYDRDSVLILPPTQFGDCYYAMEALTLVATWTADDTLRQVADAAFDRWVNGEHGLRAVAREGYWWPMGNLWADSKLAGIPALLAKRARRPSPPWLQEMVLHQMAWLDDDGRAARIGVRCSPAAMQGEYALTATGFAGLSACAAVKMRAGFAVVME